MCSFLYVVRTKRRVSYAIYTDVDTVIKPKTINNSKELHTYVIIT